MVSVLPVGVAPRPHSYSTSGLKCIVSLFKYLFYFGLLLFAGFFVSSISLLLYSHTFGYQNDNTTDFDGLCFIYQQTINTVNHHGEDLRFLNDPNPPITSTTLARIYKRYYIIVNPPRVLGTIQYALFLCFFISFCMTGMSVAKPRFYHAWMAVWMISTGCLFTFGIAEDTLKTICVNYSTMRSIELSTSLLWVVLFLATCMIIFTLKHTFVPKNDGATVSVCHEKSCHSEVLLSHQIPNFEMMIPKCSVRSFFRSLTTLGGIRKTGTMKAMHCIVAIIVGQMCFYDLKDFLSRRWYVDEHGQLDMISYCYAKNQLNEFNGAINFKNNTNPHIDHSILQKLYHLHTLLDDQVFVLIIVVRTLCVVALAGAFVLPWKKHSHILTLLWFFLFSFLTGYFFESNHLPNSCREVHHALYTSDITYSSFSAVYSMSLMICLYIAWIKFSMDLDLILIITRKGRSIYFYYSMVTEDLSMAVNSFIDARDHESVLAALNIFGMSNTDRNAFFYAVVNHEDV